ncbi:MAG TPA: DUF4153 domain-containing protein, partial [candidate division Zixibacteria bacterium]|nr:DUF4153 domain-containing protein [candidate division Zixibacteria bacterium]
YILLPLVLIYAAILYAFMGKILIQWSWPEGWVSRLILWYAAVGSLMLLLLRPLTDQASQRWVRIFETWYYRAMIPLAIVLPLALYRRFGEYGLTEARYLGFALAFALILVVIYFNFRKERDTRAIPATLALLGLVAGLGPWSAIALSRTDQLERFSALVTEHKITFEAGAPERRADLPAEVRAELSHRVRHLNRHYGLESLSPWLSDSVLLALKDTTQHERSQEITRLMGFEFIFAAAPLRAGWVRLTAPETDALPVQGYDFVVRARTLKPQPDTTELRIIDDSLRMSLVIDNDRQGVALWTNDPAADTFFISLAELIAAHQTAGGSEEVGWDEMTFEGEGERLALRMYLRLLNLHIEDDKPYIQNLDADLLLRMQD